MHTVYMYMHINFSKSEVHVPHQFKMPSEYNSMRVPTQHISTHEYQEAISMV